MKIDKKYIIFVLFLEIWSKSEFKFKYIGKKNELVYFKKTVLQTCRTTSIEPKISSIISEPNNKVCGQATVLKPCQEIFKY